MNILMWKGVHHQLIEEEELQDILYRIGPLLSKLGRTVERQARCSAQGRDSEKGMHFLWTDISGKCDWKVWESGSFYWVIFCLLLCEWGSMKHVVCVCVAHACLVWTPPSDSLSVVLSCTGRATSTSSPSGNSPIVFLHIRFPTPHPQCLWAAHKGGLQPGRLAVAPGDSSSFI